MSPWTDPLVWIVPALNAAVIFWVQVQLHKISTRGSFVLTRGMPFVNRPRRITQTLVGIAGCGIAMWFLGCIIKSEGLALCGNGLLMMNLILAGLLGYVLRVQLRQQMRRITLTGEPVSSLVLEEPGRTRCLELANARVLGWHVADAPYIQLRIEDESGFALRLFLSPEQRHVVLTAGFRVLDTYEGWSPITRSNELLDLLAPFILPGELAEFGDDRDLE